MAVAKKLLPAESALLVVDIQEKLMAVIDERDRVVKNAALLIKAAKALRIPILASTQYRERIGALLPEITAELGTIAAVDKMEFDCLANGTFRKQLDTLPVHIDNLILCGVETHICVYQTALGGIMAGYRMWLAADAASSRLPSNHRAGVERIRDLGGEIGSTELIIYEWLHRAGTPEFKSLLPFIK